MGGSGAAARPLIGGVIASGIGRRAACVFQAAIVAAIVLLSRRLADPVAPDPTRPFDASGALLSAGLSRPLARADADRARTVSALVGARVRAGRRCGGLRA